MKEFNKLVRDRIPEIIKKNNAIPNTRVLSESEYMEKRNEKLFEEVNEFIEAKTIEDQIGELSDILELIHQCIEDVGTTYEEVESARLKKKESRGGFEKKILLISTEEK